jgi:hypothetical protein
MKWSILVNWIDSFYNLCRRKGDDKPVSEAEHKLIHNKATTERMQLLM